MVNLKKYNVVTTQFVLFLTFIFVVSCGPKQYHVTKVEGKEINIDASAGEVPTILEFITPYREHIDADLNTVLAFAPQTFDKSGQWQTSIGNIMADESLKRSNYIFKLRENKDIDICLLNIGGVRSIIPKGDVTTRTAFEIMPFENSLVVAELKGAQIMEMIQYIIAEKKAHPLSGLTFEIAKDGTPTTISVQRKPFDISKTYEVVTSDYLINGGDRMDFFKKAVRLTDIDYKLRNVLIDYFKEVDTIVPDNSVRIRMSK